MSEHVDNREHARSVRRRLNDHSIDIEVLALEAMQVFDAAHLAAQMRWLNFELTGYTAAAETSSVHQLLGLPSGDRLVVQVKTYRVQAGQLAEGPKQGVTFHHFFVDPLRDLVAAQARLRQAARDGHRIRLDFAVNESKPYLPVAGMFRADTFDRVVLGFRAVLHLQLGSVTE
jgi:hypothetical protein